MINTLAKQDLINRNYNHIYAHEMAHKSAGGQFAGAISIERNSEEILYLVMFQFKCQL